MRKILSILTITLLLSWATFAGASGIVQPPGTDAITIHSLTVEIPDAADDGKYIMYDHGTTSWILDTPAGGGDMTAAVWDGDSDGFIDADAGGTDADSSAATGLAQVIAGAWSFSDTIARDITYYDDSGSSPSSIWMDKDEKSLTIYKGDAGWAWIGNDEGAIYIAPSNDEDSFLSISTTTNNTMISALGTGNDLQLRADGGDIDCGDENIKTTAGGEFGSLTRGSVSDTEFSYLDGVTSGIQAQLNAKQPLDAELTALAGLTSAEDKLPYFTASETASVTSFTAFARTILDDADAATVRGTLGLVIGTNVQAYSAHLDDLADGTLSGSKIGITGTTATTAIEALDELLIYDVSASANRKITRGNFLAGMGVGQAVVLDLGDDGDNESSDLGEIAIVNDTNSIFTESSDDKLLIDVSQNWPTADVANAGDSATAFFNAGTIEHEYGGLEADVSEYDGLVRITGGATSAVTISANGISLIGAANYAAMRTLLDLEAGTDFHAYDADLATLATPNVWKIFYSDGSSVITELTVGGNGTFLSGNGATSAPEWRLLSDGDIPDLSAVYEAVDAEIVRADTADTIGADWEWQDGIPISFGNDNDWEVAYDEAGEDRLEFVHTAGAGADVYWDLNDNAADSTFSIVNTDGTYKANLVVDGTISQGGALLSATYQPLHAYLTDIAGISAVQGDIIYFNGTDWVRLGYGTVGYYLQTQGSGANPTWSSGNTTGVNETYGAGWNADPNAPEKDDIYDYLHALDTDDDGDIDTIDATLWATKQGVDATLTALAGLTIQDVSIIEGTGADAFGIVASGGNNYILGSNSNNTALEFKTPANVLTQIGGQGLDATLTTLAAGLPEGYVWQGAATGEPVAVNELKITSVTLNATPDAMDDDTYNGITIKGINFGETVAQWACVFLAADGKLDIANAAAAGEFPAMGIATAGGNDTDPAVILVQGVARNEGWAGLTVGGAVYLGESGTGAITQTAPSTAGDCVQIIGRAVSDSEIYFNFTPHWLEVE